MRSLLILISILFISNLTFAGGLEISGNGQSVSETQKAVKLNLTRLVSISKASCPRSDRKLIKDDMSRIKVNFVDGKEQVIIPLKLEPVGGPNQSGQQKYILVYLDDDKNQQLSVQTREIFIDEKFKHENVLKIVWRSSDGSTHNVKNFEKLLDFESRDECAIYSLIGSNPDIKNIIDTQPRPIINGKGPAPFNANEGKR